MTTAWLPMGLGFDEDRRCSAVHSVVSGTQCCGRSTGHVLADTHTTARRAECADLSAVLKPEHRSWAVGGETREAELVKKWLGDLAAVPSLRG